MLSVRKLKDTVWKIRKELTEYMRNPVEVNRTRTQLAIGFLVSSLKEYEVDDGEYDDRVVCVLPKNNNIVVLKLKYNTRRGQHDYCLVLTPHDGEPHTDVSRLASSHAATYDGPEDDHDSYHSETDATQADSDDDCRL